MPEDRIPISEFSYTDSLNNSDNLPIIQTEGGGSYENFRTDIAAVADHMLNNMEFVSDLHTTAKKIIPAINEAAQGGGGGSGVSASVIADEYDPTATYNTGDYCIYNGGLYVCNDDNVTGAWNSAKWTSIQVMSAVSSIPTDAEHLSITSGSATNTKDYIDSKTTLTDGTVTWNTTNVDGDISKKVWYQYGRIVIAHLEFTPLSGKIANGNVICSGLPVPTVPYYTSFGGNSQQLTVNSSGELVYWYPTDTTTLRRTDITLVYTK